MDYLYENLGDERFQEFCSCLISKEFPNAQSFPVGQPDGGRDSLVYSMNTTKKEFIVFQVKFVRNANQNKDIHKWLIDTIEGEIKKIERLIPLGAKGYYLLTNVRGTGHMDVGSKDKVNKILEDNIKIPSICWWREDLSMLFEKDPIFKWSFPEILNGQDILNSVLFNNLNENRERRENVIRAYLADQYEMDNEVKFRQIDLQNGLFDLFTDVPIQIKKLDEKNKVLKNMLNMIESSFQCSLSSVENFFMEESSNVGAAAFLLHPKVQGGIGKILLEGGPGQGKSTISQYVSQVHRVKLLNKTFVIVSLPDNIKNTPVRLPFKIDLRHIADWVEKKNPYLGILSEEYFLKIWQKSLESFLVGHIYFHSKLEGFNSNDFIAICKLSPILLVFDGFDEIANLKVREEVIEFINKGINRIAENSQSIQVLITSRPAAFSDSIGFSVDIYPQFELTDITPAITQEYVEKWIKASRLNSREASEIRRLVKEKMNMPLLRDLTKSPMQLAIFISLLRTRGESLPNKRTALYDSYIELFFNRESEKNSIIRDHRDLIIDIHEYLAWILHSEAELYKNSGTIHIDELKKRLNEYLLREGHQTDITDKLFQVVEERVCALVSRVQGTFEFEVQPLREYFCAKYLYKTSPYSPVGAERTGTLPDRFEAISRNFYWQNVVRFFAGCFSKGELSMLIQKLRELVDDDTLKYTNYPRIITSQLLSDYVFAQYPLLLKNVVKIIIDGINIGNIIDNEDTNSNSNNESIVLPSECGRTEVVIECFNQLKTFPASDYASELIKLIKNNPYQIMEIWSEHLPQLTGEQLSSWLEYAYRLQIIHRIDESVLVDIVNRDNFLYAEKRLQILIYGNRTDVIEKNPEFKELIFNGILAGRLNIPQRPRTSNSLQFLKLATNSFSLSQIFSSNDINISYITFLLRRRYHTYKENVEELFPEFEVNDSIDRSIESFLKSIRFALESNLSNWRESIEAWDILVENGRSFFNNSWNFSIIATISAGIKSKVEIFEEFSNLSDSNISLCKRARYARMKSGNPKYWIEQMQNDENLLFKLLVFFTWATSRTIVQLSETISSKIDLLESDKFLQLAEGIRITSRNSLFNKRQKNQIINDVNHIPIQNSIKFLLSLRFDLESKGEFICNNIDRTLNVFDETNKLKLEYLLNKYLMDSTDEHVLSQIKKLYEKVKKYDERIYFFATRRRNPSVKIPLQIAKKIMINCKEYPRIIAVLAEKSCKLNAYENLIPVGEVAEKEKWFE